MFDRWGNVAARISPTRQPYIDEGISRRHAGPATAIDAARALLDDQISA